MSEYMALYRKWRPSVFADVIGQDHITKVLRSEVMQKSVSHAYLFCGSRGTGKTTCAKILAKAISCENPQGGDPCGKCPKCLAFSSSLDIVEMDAASNNGVDDIRELRERISFMPIEMKRRVYIIDEVHMLSAGAFNALLKTLEEPPEHVMFILATTELNKIPATILSRCKRFDFHRISAEDMLPRLKQISDSEGIGIDTEALRLIATLASGAMRDALSMLELFVGQSGIDREKAADALGVIGNGAVLSLIRDIADKNVKGALETVAKAYDASKDMSVLCSELGEMFRNLLIMKYASSSVSALIDAGSDVIATLRDCEERFTPERLLYCTEIVEQTQNKLSRSGLSRRNLTELMIMRLCDSRLADSPAALLERISALEQKASGFAPINASPAQKKTPEAVSMEVTSQNNLPDGTDGVLPYDDSDVPPDISKDAPTVPEYSENPDAPGNMSAFAEVLDDIKEQNMILYSMIVDARAFLNGDNMILEVNPMGLFMITGDDGMKHMIESAASARLGYAVKLTVREKPKGKDSDNGSDLSSF